jgi:hypothetical protein
MNMRNIMRETGCSIYLPGLLRGYSNPISPPELTEKEWDMDPLHSTTIRITGPTIESVNLVCSST